MFYVYVVHSVKERKLYIGYAEDLRRRVQEHNAGSGRSTKFRKPFELIYYEAYRSKTDATTRERKLKKFKNAYAELKKRIAGSLTEA